ncbi:Fc.00g020200.m01.CDS01 [Cosmosporella sp. VM-42]
MASPNVFRSSQSRANRHEYHVVRSSSPDLPPLQDFLPQKTKRPPPLRSGSKAAPIPENASTSFISAGSLWGTAQVATEDSPINQLDTSTTERADNADAQDPVIEISKPARVTKPRKPRKRKEDTNPIILAEASQGSQSPEGDKPWKKYQSPPRANNAKGSTSKAEIKVKNTASRARRKTGSMNNHFAPEPQSHPVTKPQTKVPDEPLHLEPAALRRIDWTPPAQKTVINLDSDSSALRQLGSSGTTVGQATKFKNLLQGYTREEDEPQAAAASSGEDSSFLKKRKLIELVVTKDTNSATPIVPEKSPIKQKAPKKKPRTITAIATAAYKQATQPDLVPPPSSLLNYFPNDGVASETSTTDVKKGKGKAKPRKRAPRASKKKAPPPKPILLSPGAALRQVANQDFVFGTSSQLAREPSPTLLRDLQATIRHSYQFDDNEFMTPINSDAIEPPEQRPRLWEAGNRDAEGDLFDIEVINLADGSPQLPPIEGNLDPFGYVKADDAATTVDTNVISLASDNSFINLSDILPPPKADCGPPIDEGSPFFSDSDMPASTNIPRRPSPPVEGTSTPPTTCRTEEVIPAKDQPIERDVQPHPSRPGYELYTDIQLAKEITSYGFKPVKRRNAMIALLDQCWQSKTRMGQAGIHTSATLSAASKAKQSATLATNPKKPRGRPRKASISAPEPQEPPPSAQPASSPPLSQSPKRPRGRPRKDAASPPKASLSRAKPRSPKKAAPAPSTPKRKKVATKPVIEIPDSASDNLSDLSSSPCSSSPEEMFSSPPPLDLSLGEDNELSLAASPDDQQAALFSHITKAITTAPRTTDSSNPSWHEKILLYDPIILEDLTAWLNSGQLTRVGYDEEIYPALVKKWCESKSVCSVWRVNLRGKERKRF